MMPVVLLNKTRIKGEMQREYFNSAELKGRAKDET